MAPFSIEGASSKCGAVQVAKDKRVLLTDVVERYTAIPYGWKPDWETVLIVARLFMAGEIKLTLEGSDLDAKSALDPLSKPARFKQVALLKRKLADASSLKRARELYKELFSGLPRDDEDGLVADWRQQLDQWAQSLRSFRPLATQKYHPGTAAIEALLSRINKQQAILDAFEFVEALNRDKDGWLDACEDKADLSAFYGQQLTTWRKLLEALLVFEANREALVKGAKAGAALSELEALRRNPAPYSLINRIEPLVASVQAVNDALAGAKREKALLSIDSKITEAKQALAQAGASAELSNRVLLPLQTLKHKIAGLASIPEILYLQGQAGERLDEAMDAIAAAVTAAANAAAAAAHASSVREPQPRGALAPQVLTTQDGTLGSQVISPPSAADPRATAPKPSLTVQAAHLSPKSYLESEAEVEAYLAALRQKLMGAIQAGQRVRIQ